MISAQASATRSGGAADTSDRSEVSLKDAILALKIVAGAGTAGGDLDSAIDVDGDHRIGLPEAIYILQQMSGDR